MSFRLMLTILVAFLYFGIGIGTLLKFNTSISGITARAKLIFLLPFQTVILALMIYFKILSEMIQSNVKKEKGKNKAILLKDILFHAVYALCACLKFTPIMSAVLAQLTIEQKRTSKSSNIVLNKVKSRYSDMIGEFIVLYN
ncbi:hypothetical protein SDC9_103962 [bioreactor metagenome]|uniref:Uncharacterized protein n=1 Tax=bioreactor metagenome TaxID=1076179 RepID=A0A645AXV9_9ZZZZ